MCFKARKPFCYGITNYIAATLSANVLLAVGTDAPAYDQVVWDLLTFRTTAIRDNASELIALADGTGNGRSIDTTLTSDQAQPFFAESGCAHRHDCRSQRSGGLYHRWCDHSDPFRGRRSPDTYVTGAGRTRRLQRRYCQRGIQARSGSCGPRNRQLCDRVYRSSLGD